MSLITGTISQKFIVGTPAEDVLSGSDGDDFLNGLESNDRLLGGNGNDVLIGGDGSDLLDGGAGNDVLGGGNGNDIYLIDSDADSIIEHEGSGTDTIRALLSFNLQTTAPFVEQLILIGAAAFEGIGNALDNAITGNALDNRLNGASGADFLNGASGADRLAGSIGADRLFGGAGADVLFGGPGNDVISGDSGDDLLDGGPGRDRALGGAGRDVIVWDPADTRVDGGAGAMDVLRLENGDSLDLTGIDAAALSAIEVIDLAVDGNANTLALNAGRIVELNPDSGTLRIDATEVDEIRTTDFGWIQQDDIRIEDVSYRQFENDGAVMLVSPDAKVHLAGFDVGQLDGDNGFSIRFIDGFRSVAGAGDVNGDGYDDVMLGNTSFISGGLSAGVVHVVFGSPEFDSAVFELSSLDGLNAYRLLGADPNGVAGHSINGAGDVNGDGYDDLIIGDFLAHPNFNPDAGSTYVVFGKPAGQPVSMNLSELDGSNGFALNGFDLIDRSGYSVDSAGDINGDGYDDLIIGAPLTRNESGTSGASYIIFGKESGFSAELALDELDGTNGFVLEGVSAAGQNGFAVAGAGDINGDGFDDLIIEAPNGGDEDSRYSGEAYVVFGHADGYVDRINLTTLNGRNGFSLGATDRTGHAGIAINAAGDFNGDGFDDLVVGVFNVEFGDNDPVSNGYVIFGKAGGFGPHIDLADLNGRNELLIRNAVSSGSHIFNVSGAGDVNGDGFDDVMLSTSIYRGHCHVLFGGKDRIDGIVDAAALNGRDGFTIVAPDDSAGLGLAVSAAGDVNGDGFADLIFNSDYGHYSFVVFGRDFRDEVVETTSGGQTIGGSRTNEKFVTGPGDDNVSGFGGNDTLLGASGHDILRGGTGFDRLIGGSGTDWLDGGAGNDRLFGGHGNDTLEGGTGADILEGETGKDIFLFRQIPDESNADTIVDFGGAGPSSGDLIHLDSSIFTSLSVVGPLDPENFFAHTSSGAIEPDQFIIYNSFTGELFYDADGSAGSDSEKMLVAILLTVPKLSADDFVVI